MLALSRQGSYHCGAHAKQLWLPQLRCSCPSGSQVEPQRDSDLPRVFWLWAGATPKAPLPTVWCELECVVCLWLHPCCFCFSLARHGSRLTSHAMCARATVLCEKPCLSLYRCRLAPWMSWKYELWAWAVRRHWTSLQTLYLPCRCSQARVCGQRVQCIVLS